MISRIKFNLFINSRLKWNANTLYYAQVRIFNRRMVLFPNENLSRKQQTRKKEKNAKKKRWKGLPIDQAMPACVVHVSTERGTNKHTQMHARTDMGDGALYNLHTGILVTSSSQ